MASTPSICILSSAENIIPTLCPLCRDQGGFVSANFCLFLFICQCQGLDMFRGKKNKDCHFLSTVCFSLSQFVRGNNDNGYNRILAVLERHWGLNKGSPQK